MPVYFAYGSNMDIAAMAVRCPRSTPLGLARLPRHRPTVTQRGFASVMRDPRSEVWGLLWTLALSDVPALDRWEEVSRGLYSKEIMPVIRAGSASVRALIYIARNEDAPGPKAGPHYGAAIVAAAREAGVPPAFAARLDALYAIRQLAARGSP